MQVPWELGKIYPPKNSVAVGHAEQIFHKFSTPRTCTLALHCRKEPHCQILSNKHLKLTLKRFYSLCVVAQSRLLDQAYSHKIISLIYQIFAIL